MLLGSLIPKMMGFKACIPRNVPKTISSSSSSSGSTTSLGDSRSLRQITLDESLQLTNQSGNMHAAHCLLYTKVVDNDVECIYGLCQMRFDGFLGFPGGIVGGHKEELRETGDIINGLERELNEEINYYSKPSESLNDDTSGFIHISSYVDEAINSSEPMTTQYRVNVFHFFAKQISEQEFNQCEIAHFQSEHFLLESLGLFRIPLIDPANCSDRTIFRYYKKKEGFLANFLKSNFAGIAKNQLFDTLVYLNCLSPDYLARLDQIVQKG